MDERDPPVEDQQYLSGLTVIDIGDYRISRGLTRRPFSGCPHHRLAYDRQERRVWCKDCERDVEPFDAFAGLIESYDRAYKAIEKRRWDVEEAAKFQVRSLAAKAIDKAWRKRNMVPSCPQCGMGLFPEDFKNGCSMLDREFAEMRLRKKTDAPDNP